MPRFAANLSMLFTEHPFLDRFERAARAGFGAVEFLFPYAHTPGEVAARLKGNKLQCVLHNLPAGDWDAGERGIACVRPDEAARDELEEARRVAALARSILEADESLSVGVIAFFGLLTLISWPLEQRARREERKPT